MSESLGNLGKVIREQASLDGAIHEAIRELESTYDCRFSVILQEEIYSSVGLELPFDRDLTEPVCLELNLAQGGSALGAPLKHRGEVFGRVWALCLEGGPQCVIHEMFPQICSVLELEICERMLEGQLDALEKNLYGNSGMGPYAAALAHEVHNPLHYIEGNLDLMKTQIAKGELGPGDLDDLQASLHDALFGAQYLRQIVNDLRLFTRPGDGKNAPVDINAVLDSTVRIVNYQLPEDVEIVRQDKPGAQVMAVGSRLGQVFLNLVLNASQAMEKTAGEKRITLDTRLTADGFVVIQVQDTGCGIPPEDLYRVFRPFFSTKNGTGMGIGLAVCQRIIAGFGGRIEVESQAGEGTTFTIWLPALNEASAPTADAKAPGDTKMV